MNAIAKERLPEGRRQALALWISASNYRPEEPETLLDTNLDDLLFLTSNEYYKMMKINREMLKRTGVQTPVAAVPARRA
jgi:hypothetical protein